MSCFFGLFAALTVVASNAPLDLLGLLEVARVKHVVTVFSGQALSEEPADVDVFLLLLDLVQLCLDVLDVGDASGAAASLNLLGCACHMVVNIEQLELESLIVVLSKVLELVVRILLHGLLDVPLCHLRLLVVLDFLVIRDVLEDVIREDRLDSVPVEAAAARFAHALREEAKDLLNDEQSNEDTHSNTVEDNVNLAKPLIIDTSDG